MCEDHLCTPLLWAGPQVPLFNFDSLAKEEPFSAPHTEPSSTSLPDQVCGMLLPSHACLSHKRRFERTCIPGADSPRAKCEALSHLNIFVPHFSSFSNVLQVQIQSERRPRMHKLLRLGSLLVEEWALCWKEAMIHPKAFMPKSRISSTITGKLKRCFSVWGKGPRLSSTADSVYVKMIPTLPDTALTCPEREASLKKEVHMCPLMVSPGHCSLLQSHL